jgi:hypothetical protein
MDAEMDAEARRWTPNRLSQEDGRPPNECLRLAAGHCAAGSLLFKYGLRAVVSLSRQTQVDARAPPCGLGMPCPSTPRLHWVL